MKKLPDNAYMSGSFFIFVPSMANIKHIRNRLIILLLSITFIMPTAASLVIRSTQIASKEGLPNTSVRYMMQDSKGFIWMGTLNGLARYDGISFTVYRPKQANVPSLTDRRIYEIYEDHQGYLWISTSADLYNCFNLRTGQFVKIDGLDKNRYSRHLFARNGDVWLWKGNDGACRMVHGEDGFEAIQYKQKNRALPSNKTTFLSEGIDHTIWIGTNKGLTRVATNGKSSIINKTYSFYSMAAASKQPCFVTDDGRILSFNRGLKQLSRLPLTSGEKVSGQFVLGSNWYLFTSKCLYRFDLVTHQLSLDNKLLGHSIANGAVELDNKGNYWIYNHTGNLWYINRYTSQVNSFNLIPSQRIGYIDFERYHIVQDSRGYIWISTYGNGLFVYDPRSRQMEHYTAGNDFTSPLGTDFLQCVMEDKSGDIWVGQEYLGISRISILNQNNTHFFLENPSSFDRSNTVRMICSASNGDVWIASRQGGLYIYDQGLHLKSLSNNERANIYAMKEDASGERWIGTRGDGLLVGSSLYVNNPSDASSLPNNNIFCILRDKKERMWIGTFGGGLALAEKKGNKYVFHRFFSSGTIGEMQIRTLMQDSNGMIWMGTSQGLYIFNPERLLHHPSEFYWYSFTNGKMLSDEIRCIVQDHQGHIWVGNSGAGFSGTKPVAGHYGELHFDHYTMKNGLSNDVVQSIVEDNKGNLWMSTEYGISKFIPSTKQFETYLFSAYALGNAYSENSATKLKNGNILFGSNYGVLLLDPDRVVSRKFNSPVVFTNIQVNGITINPGDEDSPLKQSLSFSEKVTLKYYQNSISVDFTSFDYADVENVKYSYKLEPYDDQWSVPSAENVATYKNLPSGKYILKVRSTTGGGSWNTQVASLKIVIEPPFYLTGWAFLLYLIIGCTSVYAAFKIILNFNRLHNKIAVENHLTEYKLMFFTNISHEFRTPLTLIEGALEKIHSFQNILPGELNHPLRILDKNTGRMMRLIDQLLEFRKMQDNKLALSLEETDVIAFLYEIFLSFGDVADQKSMDFQFLPSEKKFVTYIDKGKLDKIAYNILSNAFKYTPSGRKIKFIVNVDIDNNLLRIQVVDSGVGIPKEKQPQLFSRFMQSSFSGDSVGIGLHLTHELVLVHKGTIEYDENPEGGSIFTVKLPLDKSAYDDKDFLIAGNALLKENQEHEEKKMEMQLHLPQQMGNKPLNENLVLIIEDNDDVRAFLKDEVGAYFTVETAVDGKDGLEKARNSSPSLIVCDVMMPGMNGFQVVKSIKEDFDTSHIPIILLTALDSSENKLKGFEVGADAYITKPFSTKLLLMRIFKLIESRNNLQKKFSQEPGVQMPAIYSTDRDKDFVDKLHVILTKNLSRTDFTVDDFAQKMGIGRTIFYKKVKGLTGYSPNEYIRIIRMKTAADLLIKENCTVAEVSYKVGIDDPFYFSKCFKAQFGMAPSIFQKGDPKLKNKDNG